MSLTGIENRVLEYLRSTNASKTTRQVGYAVHVPAHEVVRVLMRLRDTGLLEKTASGWRARGLVNSAPWAAGAENGSRSTETHSTSRESRSKREALGHRTNAEAADSRQAVPEIDAESRWADFRRLCVYYAECVRLEERASVSAYADKEGTDFVSIPGPIDWRTISSGQRTRISADTEWEVFLRKRRPRERYTTFYIGTPVDVFVGESQGCGDGFRIVSPVFVTPVVAHLANGCLEFQPTNVIEINHGWLERRIRKASQRREFLEQIGLAPTALVDDEQADLWAVGGFEEAVRALFGCRRDWWREFADLAALGTEPSLASVEKSGLYNRAVLMPQPPLKYTKRLFHELQRLAHEVSDEDLDHTALVALFPHDEVPGKGDAKASDAAGMEDVAEFCLLNQDQRTACRQSLNQSLTVVTGPPGTGKSVVVAHVLANSAIIARPALFASRNHQALEAVEPKLNAMTEPETLLLRPTRPFGAQAAQFEWHQAMTALLARPRRAGIDGERAEAFAALRSTLDRRRSIESLMADLIDSEDALVEAEAMLRDRLLACPVDWEDFARSRPALPSKEVTAQLHARALRLMSQQVPWFLRPIDLLLRPFRLRSVRRQFDTLRAKFDSAAGELLRGMSGTGGADLQTIHDVSGKWHSLVELVDSVERCDSVQQRLLEIPEREKLRNDLREVKTELEAVTLRVLRLIAESAGANISEEQREKFAQLRAAMRNRPQELHDPTFESEVARAFSESMTELMQHFPLWAVSNLSVSKAIPLAPAAFDLVIIDEASQCDIASVVPLLFRARAATIVGDPNQLPHVSQISRDTEMRIREQAGVGGFAFERYTFAANSMFDLAASSRNRIAVELGNHYRCHPEIADYCNRSFYNKTLHVMTDADALCNRIGLKRSARACVWHHVSGDAVSASSGCYSPNQIEAVVAELERLSQQHFAGTIGVVTPFRAQANRINDLVHQRLAQDQLTQWRFLVDTADGFQGDERDVVFFSLVGSSNMPSGSAYFLGSTPNRFNVAVSRAKAFIRVFGDEQWAEACGIPFIVELFRRCRESEALPDGVRRDDLIGPVWEPRFGEALRAADLPFEQQYPTCGYYLDFAMFAKDRKIAIEIDGETYHRAPGGGRKIDDIYRDVVLEAAGWRVLRFWVYQVRESINECVARVRSEFES